MYTCIASLPTAIDVRHELDPILVRLEIEGGAFAPSAVVAQPVIVLQMEIGDQNLIHQPRSLTLFWNENENIAKVTSIKRDFIEIFHATFDPFQKASESMIFSSASSRRNLG